MTKLSQAFTSLLFISFLSACGGGGGGGGGNNNPPPPDPITKSEAFQFLNQTTFGATEAEAQRVIDMGYETWIDEQILLPPSLQLPYIDSLPVQPGETFLLNQDRVDIWFRNAVRGNDQLRQRVAFALSEIMVVSEQGALINFPYALSSYYDLLVNGAFENYRDLIEDVTLHPAMGVYLSMLGNEKPNPTLNIRPDENYARELMQLFSIGLVELNLDGSQQLDINNQPIPTYDQAVIEGFAHVFTGWHFAGAANFQSAFPNKANQVIPMQLYSAFHDTGEKQVLNGVTIPQGQTGDQDLEAALDNIFNHANVAPFISFRLIQRLVTSNPSPAYIQRVASVFNDNGSGERGDLAAVVKAILLDPEARPDVRTEATGKMKEPLLRLTQIWRAYNATSASGKLKLPAVNFFFGQGPLQSPSVFNFFSPFYAPAGEIRNGGYTAPELQIATEYQNTFVTNYLLYQVFEFNSENTGRLEEDDIYILIDEEVALANNPTALVDRIAEKLLGGDISDTLRSETIAMIERFTDPGSEILIAVDAIYFIVTSPEFAFQK